MKKVNCAESFVGDTRIRGISGGEKKRLSLGCELIASPSIIFVDEPTTGLYLFSVHVFTPVWSLYPFYNRTLSAYSVAMYFWKHYLSTCF